MHESQIVLASGTVWDSRLESGMKILGITDIVFFTFTLVSDLNLVCKTWYPTHRSIMTLFLCLPLFRKIDVKM